MIVLLDFFTTSLIIFTVSLWITFSITGNISFAEYVGGQCFLGIICVSMLTICIYTCICIRKGILTLDSFTTGSFASASLGFILCLMITKNASALLFARVSLSTFLLYLLFSACIYIQRPGGKAHGFTRGMKARLTIRKYIEAQKKRG